MSTQPVVDFDALARKHGGVDYDALAGTHGGKAEQSPASAAAPSSDDDGFWSSLGKQVNPWPAIKDYILNGPPALQSMHAAEQGVLPNVDRGGNLLADVAQPGATAGRQVASGNLAGAAGTLTGGYVLPAAGARLAPPALDAAPVAGRMISAGARAAGPDLAAGSGKILAGTVGAELFPGHLGYVAGFYPIYSGARQLGRGFKSGLDAARDAMADPIAKARAAAEQAFLDDVSQGQLGKKFENGTAEQQNRIRSLAERLNWGQEPPAMPAQAATASAVPAAPAEPVPVGPPTRPYVQNGRWIRPGQTVTLPESEPVYPAPAAEAPAPQPVSIPSAPPAAAPRVPIRPPLKVNIGDLMTSGQPNLASVLSKNPKALALAQQLAQEIEHNKPAIPPTVGDILHELVDNPSALKEATLMAARSRLANLQASIGQLMGAH